MNRVTFFFEGPPSGAGLPDPQPTPIMTRVCRMRVGGQWVSTVVRAWLYGDPARCKLCPRCTAVGGECMLMIAACVSDQDAPLYRIEVDPGPST